MSARLHSAMFRKGVRLRTAAEERAALEAFLDAVEAARKAQADDALTFELGQAVQDKLTAFLAAAPGPRRKILRKRLVRLLAGFRRRPLSGVGRRRTP